MARFEFLTPPTRSDKAPDVFDEMGHPLKVALAYQDAVTRQWALEMYRQVSQLVGADHIHDPCKAMSPMLESVAEEWAVPVKVVRVNVEHHAKLTEQCDVRDQSSDEPRSRRCATHWSACNEFSDARKWAATNFRLELAEMEDVIPSHKPLIEAIRKNKI